MQKAPSIRGLGPACNTGLSDYARSYFVARPVPCFMIAFRLSRDSSADSVRARLSPVCFSISLRDIIRPPDKALRTWASKTKTVCVRLRTRRKRFSSYLRTVIGYKFHVHTTIYQTHSVFIRQCVRNPNKRAPSSCELGALLCRASMRREMRCTRALLHVTDIATSGYNRSPFKSERSPDSGESWVLIPLLLLY